MYELSSLIILVLRIQWWSFISISPDSGNGGHSSLFIIGKAPPPGVQTADGGVTHATDAIGTSNAGSVAQGDSSTAVGGTVASNTDPGSSGTAGVGTSAGKGTITNHGAGNDYMKEYLFADDFNVEQWNITKFFDYDASGSPLLNGTIHAAGAHSKVKYISPLLEFK